MVRNVAEVGLALSEKVMLGAGVACVKQYFIFEDYSARG